MNPAATLSAYAAALVVVFGAAVGVGHLVGPVGADPAPSAVPSADAAPRLPGGLAVSQDGFTLRLARATVPASERALLAFTIEGPDGRAVTSYTASHGKELHLVVVRRDLTGRSHVHPVRAEDGTWSTPLDLSRPGPYKVFADVIPAGHDGGLVLAADLTVPGTYAPTPLPAPAARASVDGYDVALDGRLVAGGRSRLVFRLTRDGRPVTDLEPYLGAYGHLVALREGDLAYLHVHPDGELDDPATRPGPDVSFTVEVPSPSTYRLFLDVAHGGDVRTAELTATATAAPATAGPADHGESPHGH